MNHKSKSKQLAALDHQFVWHPFTQMRDWLKRDPIVITSGKGAVLRDANGRQYLDANSSIWTNLHGHNHRKINAAIHRQLKKIAHSSALGFANEPASILAKELVNAANKFEKSATSSPSPPRSGGEGRGEVAPRVRGQPFPHLSKVFFSDDGSTAMEVALKLAYEFARRTGRKQPKFLSLAGAYHGDTVGVVSLGHIDLFHKAYSGLLFKSDHVAAPYCYRCPYNRAKPERADARDYRKCNWECLGDFERKFATQKKKGNPYAAFVFEPLMQGAAGMIPQPQGWLKRVTEIARGHGAQLIADEVMTGFGRANSLRARSAEFIPPEHSHTLKHSNLQWDKFRAPSPLFACHEENVQPDYLALAKGLTGGYSPMAATLTTQKVFDAFLGNYEEFKTFFHGHSFTGNQLGASAALASLEILQSEASIKSRHNLEAALRAELKTLWKLPNIGDVRQVGSVVGIELVRDWRTRQPFDLRERAGIRICDAMAKMKVLTRPIGNVIVLMPPYCTTPTQLRRMVEAVHKACIEVF